MRMSASYVLYPTLGSMDIQQCTSVVYTSVPTTATQATVSCYVYIHIHSVYHHQALQINRHG